MNKDLLKQAAVFLLVSAGVRYWENAEINGISDENGDLTPFRNDERWEIKIRLSDGYIVDWPVGTAADIHFKVCDDGEYWLLSAASEIIATWHSSYVPNDFLCFEDNGFGDYIIFKVSDNGFIENYAAPAIDCDEWIIDDEFTQHYSAGTKKRLTDEDIIILAEKVFGVDVGVDDTAVVFAREIEKAHGIGI